jgi:hypothetical protein
MSRCKAVGCDRSGVWKFCPWCGAALPKKPPRPERGVCRFCGGPAAFAWATHCEPCWFPRLASRLLRGHTRGELAALSAGGATWKQIAEAFGIPGPRKGPATVRWAAELFWETAGSPGEPAYPEEHMREHDTRKAALACPEWRAWDAARSDAVGRWLETLVGAE